MRTFEGRQLSAARALAELTVAELAEAAGVTARTINRLETGGIIRVAPKRRHGHVSLDVFDKISAALAESGVKLVAESENSGAGVRWALPRARRGG